MLKRKAYSQILEWGKSDAGKVLLVTGARQIGKSYLIQHLGNTEFSSFVEINLIENDEARRALAQAVDVDDLIARVSLFAEKPLIENDALILIDEIQELPELMTMAKFLALDGRYKFAFSGSLLGIHFKHIRSYPVGYVQEISMYPMVFEEFCWALGISNDAMDEVKRCCKERQALPEYLHEAFMRYFRTYLVVGGMPEAVQKFLVAGREFSAAFAVLDDLVKGYAADIMKYAGSRALNVKSIFDELPIQLDNASQRFMLSSIDKNARYERYQQDFMWLVDAGVALKCDQVREPHSPLKDCRKSGLFKLYESDTGMLVNRYSREVAQAIYTDASSANLGSIYENVVAQHLNAWGLRLFYYMTKKRGEVDFVLEHGAGSVLAIEAKSGRAPRAHAALDGILDDEAYNIPLGIVLSRLNVEESGKVLYLPWYSLLCLDELICNQVDMGKADLPTI